MGVAPTTSRSTTERSAVELRNHWRVEPESHRRVESLQLSALLLGDLPEMTDLDSNQDRSGQNRSCCRVLHHPSVERSAGFAPALPRWQRGVLLDELRSHVWWSRGELNPRSAVCKAAVLPLNDGPTCHIQFSKNWGEQRVSNPFLRSHKPTCMPLHHARHGATPQIRTEPVRFTKAVLVLTSMCGVPEERLELSTVSL